MEQIYTLFCSFTLLILHSWMFSVINSSKMYGLKTIQEFPRTLEDIQGHQNVFQGSRTWQDLTANSRTIVGAHRRLAILLPPHIYVRVLLFIGVFLVTAMYGYVYCVERETEGVTRTMQLQLNFMGGDCSKIELLSPSAVLLIVLDMFVSILAQVLLRTKRYQNTTKVFKTLNLRWWDCSSENSRWYFFSFHFSCRNIIPSQSSKLWPPINIFGRAMAGKQGSTVCKQNVSQTRK